MTPTACLIDSVTVMAVYRYVVRVQLRAQGGVDCLQSALMLVKVAKLVDRPQLPPNFRGLSQRTRRVASPQPLRAAPDETFPTTSLSLTLVRL